MAKPIQYCKVISLQLKKTKQNPPVKGEEQKEKGKDVASAAKS